MNRPRIASLAAGVFYSAGGKSARSVSITLKYICIAAMVLVVLPSLTAAQTVLKVHGIVYDAGDGHPVAGAAVLLIDYGFSTLSDQNGRYRFDNLPVGEYIITVAAEGYYPDTLSGITITEDLTRHIDFHLQRKIYRMPDARTVAAAPSAQVSGVEVITRAEIDSSAARTVAEILNKVEGVYVREDGAGRAEVNIRGSSSEHVLVLVDGQQSNAAGDGVADIGAIPLAAVEKIEVYRGGQSARFGSAAIGGVINISTHIADPGQPSQLSAGQFVGKWKTIHTHLGLTRALLEDKAVMRVNYIRKASNNDFPFRYAVEPQPDITRQYDGTRYNADYRSENYFAAATVRLSPLLNLSLSALEYDARGGLPGYASKPDSGAYKEDTRRSLTASCDYFWTPAGPARVNLGYTRNRQYFNNVIYMTLPPQYENRTVSDRYSLQVAQSLQATNFWRMEAGIDLGRDRIEQDNLLAPDFSIGKSSRDSRGLYAVSNFSLPAERVQRNLHLSLEFSLRYDNSSTKNYRADTSFAVSQWSPHTGVNLRYGQKTEFTLRASYGRSYRLPAINSLFWKGDARSEGNPALLPEQAEQSEVGLAVKTTGRIRVSAGVTYYHNFVRNLIVWQPGAPGGVWKPVNLNRTLTTGHEEFITCEFFDKLFELTYRNTITVAKDATSDKILTYRPHYISIIEAKAKYRVFYAQYDVRMVARRFNKSANTRWDPAYQTADLVCGSRFKIGRMEFDGAYRVTNLRDENYILISHYPMPGRHWGIDLSLSLNF